MYLTNEQLALLKANFRAKGMNDEQIEYTIAEISRVSIPDETTIKEVDMIRNIADIVKQAILSLKTSSNILWYRIGIIIIIVGCITVLSATGKISGCETSTLLASVIGYILGKSTFFS